MNDLDLGLSYIDYMYTYIPLMGFDLQLKHFPIQKSKGTKFDFAVK